MQAVIQGILRPNLRMLAHHACDDGEFCKDPPTWTCHRGFLGTDVETRALPSEHIWQETSKTECLLPTCHAGVFFSVGTCLFPAVLL